MTGRFRLLQILSACVLVAGILILWQDGRLYAQATVTTPIAVVTPEGITADQVNVVARELWCPLCNGVRLDSCELKACAQMRDVIAIKLGDGENTESIKQYFLDSYGPQVLGAPPFEGFNWLAWLLPPLVLLMGGALLFLHVRRMTQPDAPLPVPSASMPHAASLTASAAQPALESKPEPSPAARQDKYTQRLEEELKYE